MSLEYLIGPAGSGKTDALLETARELCRSGRRVLWIGLPQQRNHILSRLSRDGGVVGFEYISEQQLCYRLLSRARQLKPLKVGTERLALIGAVLRELLEDVPMPGEARLFAAAIAELKRNGVDPAAARILAFDRESVRLAEVYARYEEHKGDAWDYDDYRSQALQLARRGEADSGVELIIVSGYRELLPMTVQLYTQLSKAVDVRVALPDLPDLPSDADFSETDWQPDSSAVRSAFRAPNEVEEARWVLRSIKQELATGTDMSELALVVPRASLWAYVALAEDYGVPLMPELQRSLADSRAGHMLLELINLADEFITPSALLVLPGLEQLAAVALDRRISGRAALLRLALQLDAREAEAAEEAGEAAPDSHHERLQHWLRRMDQEQPGPDWAVNLVQLVVQELMEEDFAAQDAQAFAGQALQRAREAAQLGEGDSFRAWWAALLEDTRLPVREPAGVALLSPELSSGRHYRRAWLAGVTEGQYLPGPAEDYFLPEELRSPGADVGELPRRFTAQTRLVLDELLQLADELTVTYAQSSQGGQNTPQQELVGAAAGVLPELPAGNSFELQAGFSPSLSHDLDASLVTLPRPEVRWLMRYGECPHREWTVNLLRRTGDAEPAEVNSWQRLRRDLVRSDSLTAADLDRLALEHPPAAAWLGAHASLLLQLRFGLYLPQPKGAALRARVDAAGRIDGLFSIFRLVGPEDAADSSAATELISSGQAERWLANYMLEVARKPERLVRIFVWPIGSAPLEAGQPGGQDVNQRWLRIGLGMLDDHLETYQEGVVAPRPGFRQCRSCTVRDFCRRGAV